ncbi:Aristolochene synthase in complex with 12,13 Difluorofarnesyl diphosphate [Xylariales sp. PMI_506]|nr:Aristolochene synthase in complex with 12,13 Difluorofarnesyl diphosphate [Xylariales sp. PMI_506]
MDFVRTFCATLLAGFKAKPQESYPKSIFVPRCHRLVERCTSHVDGYFLKHWPFPNEKSRKKFVETGFSRITCLFFPFAKDDRIELACRVFTMYFILDDLLEDMSFADGHAYHTKLEPIARGDTLPDRNIPVEWMIYDLWEDLRRCDKELADDILEPAFEFLRAATDPVRSRLSTLGAYLEYRKRDSGHALASAVMRFGMDIRFTDKEKLAVKCIDDLCAKEFAVVNDIWSFQKEVVKSKECREEGSVLCSSVSIMQSETGLSLAATKQVLYLICREWEIEHDEAAKTLIAQYGTSEIQRYIKGSEQMMSGNEKWSLTTARYKV